MYVQSHSQDIFGYRVESSIIITLTCGIYIVSRTHW